MWTGQLGCGRWLRVLATVSVSIGLGWGSAGPAGAQSEQEAFDNVRDRFIWTGWSDSRPVSPFVGIPFEFTQGAPFARSHIDSLPGRAEAFAGYYYADATIEETYEASGYQNPTLARCNFPDIGRGTEAEVALLGPSGPRSAVKTPSRTEAYAEARDGVEGGDLVGGAYATTSTIFDRQELMVAESYGAAQSVRLGDDTTVGLVESWVKVDHHVDQDPVVSYRLMLGGLRVGGEQLVGMGGEGITLGGNEVAGPELVDQFNAQVKEHGGILEEVAAKVTLRLLQPRIDKQDNGAYLVTGPVAELRSDNTPRKEQVGDNLGVRFGYMRTYTYLRPASGSESPNEAAAAESPSPSSRPDDGNASTTNAAGGGDAAMVAPATVPGGGSPVRESGQGASEGSSPTSGLPTTGVPTSVRPRS